MRQPARRAASRTAFLAELTALAASLRRQIEAECDGFAPDPAASSARRARVRTDFSFFRRTYFPHYSRSLDDSVLHLWLDRRLPEAVDAPEGVKLALAAPRGEAKSTFVALFFVLWCVLTERKTYVVLIADALEQAAALLEAIKAELDANPRLRLDFPDHSGVGRVWNVATVVTAKNAKVQAFGSGKKMRGLRHGPYRPDLIVLDDLENDENVQKPEQRDKLQGWLQRTVLSLGPADDSADVILAGTILHYDSVLARTLAKPQWHGARFRAVLSWPERMDLWDRWEATLKSEGAAAAWAYYEVNRTAMERGATTSWPGYRPLYKVMLKRAEDHAAFDAEQQNDPACGDGAPFEGAINFFTTPDPAWLYFGACDPSMGKAGAGRDPSAILVGGLCRTAMRLHVVEALIAKRHPDRIIADIIDLQRRYRCVLWGVETVQFQEFFAHILAQEAVRQGVVLPVQGIAGHSDKRLRIETLQPYMRAGRILLHPSQTTLISQLRHFPKADHDDGPDALEMLWRMATRGFGGGGTYRRVIPRRFGLFAEEEDEEDDQW